MRWIFVLLIVAALVVALRVYFAVRRGHAGSREDWDAHMVRDLRAAGANAFTPYEVDFFFSLPDEAACASVRSALEPEGFVTDSRDMGSGSSGHSLHASKRVRVTVTNMQDYAQRFRTLAERSGGSYDGWTTDPSRT